MNNKFKRVTMMMVACLVAAMFFGNSARAAANDNKAAIDVKQVFNVIGTDSAPSDEFTYKLTSKAAGNPMPSGGDTFTMKGNNAVHTIEIPFSTAGDYSYELEQVKGAEKGYTYAPEKYTIEVYVRGNNSNALTITPVVRNQNGDKPEVKTFTCSYNAAEDDRCLTTDPPVRKTVKGNPAKTETFEFVLKAQNASNPMPAGSVNGEKTVTAKGGETTEFGVWEYTAAGTYVYTVSEKNTGIQDYTYDNNVYTITDTVTESNGKLTLSRVVKDASDKEYTGTIEFEFVNEYTGTQTKEPTPTTSGNNGGGGKEGGGIFGPKTGDFFNNKPLMITVFGGAVVAIAAVCWIVSAKRKNREE